MGNKLEDRWIVDTNRYLQSDIIVELVVDNFAPSMKVVCYEKAGVKLFYMRHGTLFFYPVNWDIGITTVFNCIFNTIEEWLLEIKYEGKFGFELCEIDSMNNVIEYLINKRGLKTSRIDGILFVEYNI